MQQLKHLKPSMRENKRYLWIESENKINLRESVEKAILEFIGIRGLSKCEMIFIKTEDKKAIISVNRNSVDSVRASIAIWPEKMRVRKVSGTIKGL